MQWHLVVHEARVPRQRQQRLAGGDICGREQLPAPPVPFILRDAQHLPPHILDWSKHGGPVDGDQHHLMECRVVGIVQYHSVKFATGCADK